MQSTVPSAGQSPYRIWFPDYKPFASSQICQLRHNFHEHPLMQLPALAELAKEIYPNKQCRFVKPGMTQKSPFLHDSKTHDGRDVDEVFARIDKPGSWIALYNVETVPRYKAFLDEVMESVRARVEAEQPGIFNVNGFIFISGPPSVTPFHIDRENNFWLQIAGRKTMEVFDRNDRELLAQKDIEDFIVFGTLDNVQLREGMEARSHRFEVRTGDGVYFPATSPHMTRSDRDWVTADDAVSISIGVVFYTSLTRLEANVHALNRVLRRLGMHPRPPGESLLLDRIKFPFAQLLVRAHKLFRDYKPKPGIL